MGIMDTPLTSNLGAPSPSVVSPSLGAALTLDELVNNLKKHHNERIVFTNGCFDILHIGHVRYLQEAKACGDVLVVGVDNDESVRMLKGPHRPIQKQEDRAEILLALSCVDYVCFFGNKNPLPLIENIKPHVLVKGGDWPIDRIVGADFMRKNGGIVKSLQLVSGHSTTDIVERVVHQITHSSEKNASE